MTEDSIFEEQGAPAIPLNLPEIKLELRNKSRQCQDRGLAKTFKWLAEISHALKSVKLEPHHCSAGMSTMQEDEDDLNEFDIYIMAKSYFDLKEYDRCAFFTKDAKTAKVRFLHFYARYLSGEKKRLDDMTDCIKTNDAKQNQFLARLREEMEKLHKTESNLDGYTLYLYGVVLKKLNLNVQARKVLLEAIEKEPCHWGTWLELSGLVNDRNEIQRLELPDHWIKHLFLAHTYLELQLNDQALEIYFGLQQGGLHESTYILAQVAIAFHNMREVDQAVDYFKQLSTVDPFRLDNLDTYSNLLYVKEQRVELAHLAHKTSQIDKYRTETCCVIGNYYSLRSDHEKAVVYFQRALKLNPNYLSAWTLMGHEFIELKNTNAAIQSYRHAIEVSKRDYRAWYGLGQTYELLKMPFYCLYYYKKAQELRPDDSRMLAALGESYDKLDRHQDAMKCFWKAHCVGDIEGGIALYQLAKLYEKANDSEQAAAAYQQYILDSEANGINDRDQQSRAYKFLANYFLKKDNLEAAYEYSQKCMDFADIREEAKVLLKEIAQRRGQLQLEEPSLVETSGTDMAQQIATDEGSLNLGPEEGNASACGTTKLEPMNLTFTP